MYPSNEGAWLRVSGWSVCGCVSPSVWSSDNAWTSCMGDHVTEVRVGCLFGFDWWWQLTWWWWGSWWKELVCVDMVKVGL